MTAEVLSPLDRHDVGKRRRCRAVDGFAKKWEGQNLHVWGYLRKEINYISISLYPQAPKNNKGRVFGQNHPSISAISQDALVLLLEYFPSLAQFCSTLSRLPSEALVKHMLPGGLAALSRVHAPWPGISAIGQRLVSPRWTVRALGRDQTLFIFMPSPSTSTLPGIRD